MDFKAIKERGWSPADAVMIDAAQTAWLCELFDQSLARETINARETMAGFYKVIIRQELGPYVSLLAYGCENPSRRRRTKMDVDKMVETWLPLVKQLATAHDVDEKDAASSALDEHLLPVIAVPVGQIRKFYRKLVVAMKADPAMPWAVWRLFEFWGTNVLDKITREEEAGLKRELATKIAERSMQQVRREDWVNAMAGALEWRSPEKLAEIDDKLASGHKPRVRGKESCLFLDVGGSEVML